jgi:methylenetetrahydrofolate reductase (NADPH)
MKIRDMFGRGRPLFSFEFFPPKTDEGVRNLYRTIEELQHLRPAFVSVTYGAGGGTRDRTLEIVQRTKHELGIEAAAHLTCVGHSRGEIRALLGAIVDAGIENVVALRGDPPRGEGEFVPAPDGYRYASELIRAIRADGLPLCVVGAAYPEGHLECQDKRQDLLHLKEKVEAGADCLITQLFFDNAFYFDFVVRAREIGVSVPITPGIMPITNVEQMERFTRMCGASIPMRLLLALERVRDDPQAALELGVSHATIQCVDLLERGAPGIHFYTLNKSPATRMILTALQAHFGWD